MKRSKALPIGAIIDQMIDATGMRAQVQKRSIENIWPSVVGPSIAAYTRRVWLQDKVLHVQLSSAALKEELGYLQDNLVEHINTVAGYKAVIAIKIH